MLLKSIVKHIILLSLLLSSAEYIKAQSEADLLKTPYDLAFGLKIGNLIQFDYKQFINIDLAINASTGYYVAGWEGSFTSLVFTYHNETEIRNIIWYSGGGLALRKESYRRQLGLATAIGLEYILPERALNFFIDIQPAFYLKRRSSFFSSSTPSIIETMDLSIAASLGIRYIIH